MAEDNAVRSAIVKTESVPEVIVEKKPAVVPNSPQETETKVPIAFYKDLHGKPYSAEFFDIQQYRDMPDSLKTDLSLIDMAYKIRVGNGTYEDGKNTFQAMIEEAEQVTNTKNSNHNVKIAKIAEYLRFIERLKNIDSRRENDDY